MARMIPETLPADAPTSEKIMHAALAKLDQGWTVLWSVSWQSERGSREGDGEADFVLVNPRYGVIVLEVKGGGVGLREGEWTSKDRYDNTHKIKNPYSQATASKHALHRYLSKKLRTGSRIRIGHAVALPDISAERLTAPYAPTEITLDQRKLDSIERFFAGLVRHWGLNSKVGASELNELVKILRPTISIQVTLKSKLGDVTQRLLELTAEQIQLLSALRVNRRMVINGVAGSGKTVLAIQKAKDFSGEGLRTLLVCYNKPLAEWLKSILQDEPKIVVSTFHALCFSEARRANLKIPDSPSDEWFEAAAANSLIEAAEICGTVYDAVVIDEGQDFREDWVTSLQMMLTDPDESPVYLFMDAHQQLYRERMKMHDVWPVFNLYINCRNTRQIADAVARVFGDEPVVRAVDGPMPKVFCVANLSSALETAQDEIYQLIRAEALDPRQIVAITDSKQCLRALSELTVEDISIHTEPDAGVLCSTIHRYKGLESDVIIVLLAGGGIENPSELRELIYVALSRPRTYLCVICTRPWHDAINQLFHRG